GLAGWGLLRRYAPRNDGEGAGLRIGVLRVAYEATAIGCGGRCGAAMTRLRPPFLAAYSASSTRFNSASRVSSPWPVIARPTLIVTASFSPFSARTKGSSATA